MYISIFDIVICTIFLFSGLFGFLKGFLKLTISLSIFFISILITFVIFPFTQLCVKEYVSNEALMNVLSGIGAYFFSLIVCFFSKRSAYKLVEDISGGFIDRFFGLCLGILRGFVMNVLIFIIVAVFTTDSFIKSSNLKEIWDKTSPVKYPIWFKESFTTPILTNGLNISISFFSRDWLDNKLKNITLTNWYKNKNLSEEQLLDPFKKHGMDFDSKDKINSDIKHSDIPENIFTKERLEEKKNRIKKEIQEVLK